MSNRSRVTAGFVKTVVCTTRCKKKTKKMGEAFSVKKLGKWKKNGFCFIRDKKNIRLVSMWKQCVFPDRVSPHKQENGCFDRTYTVKFCEIKKLKEKMNALLKDVFQILVVSIVEMGTAWLEP